jgi:hypothetical protein
MLSITILIYLIFYNKMSIYIKVVCHINYQIQIIQKY